MDEHPAPPRNFKTIQLPIESYDSFLVRSDRLTDVDPYDQYALYFGKNATERWDDPRKRYGVLYAGTDEECAFSETYGDAKFLTLSALRLRSRAQLVVDPAQPLLLVNLSAEGLKLI